MAAVHKQSVADVVRRLDIVKGEGDRARFLDRISDNQDKTIAISWLNAHALTVAQEDLALRSSLLQSTHLLRDGVGMSILLRLIGQDPGDNMNGTDLIPEIMSRYAGRRIALMGTQEPYLSRAADAVTRMGGKVVLRMDGFRPTESYAQALSQVEADLVVLGMGVPKQERVSASLVNNTGKPMLILNGGAILDFLSQRFPRAPMLWRRMRMEWLFRMLQEPLRLGRRYIGGGARFAAYAARLVYVMKFKKQGRLGEE